MKLKVRKYGNSNIIILPAKQFKGIKEVWVYLDEQINLEERLKRIESKL